ncbi:MAG: arsenate reductase [Saprospiraceae bacterium]|jgi:arsenate reductase
MKIYHNPRCRKSRETLALIVDAGRGVEIIEYLKNVPSKEELEGLLEKLGIEPEQIIRKSEKEYKENYKGKTLSASEWIEAMVAHPKLIERPIVVKEDKAILGRPPQNVLKLL